MRTRRPKAPLELPVEGRETLQSWAHRSRSAPVLARRAGVVPACASGVDNQTAARRLRLTQQRVGKRRRRFLDARLEGLNDEPRPGARRRIGDSEVAQVVIRTLESTPRGATRWSTREMAKATGLRRMTISRIRKAFGLQPHRSETFKHSPDPLLLEKLRDIVGLSVDPPAHAVVLCVDAKSQIQAPDRTQPLLRMRPGQVERRTHDYQRHGTTALFAALDVKTGQLPGQTRRRHRAVEVRKFLDRLEANVPPALDVHIVMDNYGAHKTALIGNWFAKQPRFHPHFTPTCGSWLNRVERRLAGLTNKQIRRGVHRSTGELERAIRDFIDADNAAPVPFRWTKNADEILASIAGFAHQTSVARSPTLRLRTIGIGH